MAEDSKKQTTGSTEKEPTRQTKQGRGSRTSRHSEQPGQEDVRSVALGELGESDDGAGGRLPRSILDPITLHLSVELGRAELSFREIQNLSQGAIVELDHMLGDPLDIRANGHLVARGEVVSIKDERYGIRITEIVRQENLPGEDA